MTTQPSPPGNREEQLNRLLPKEQRDELAKLLAELLAHGFGSVVISVESHQIRFLDITKRQKAWMALQNRPSKDPL